MARNLRFKDEHELSAFLRQRGGLSEQSARALAATAGVKSLEKRKNKLGAQRIQHDGITFDSKHEGERYLLLKQRMMAKEIAGLECHMPMRFEERGKLIFTLFVDFVYYELPVKRKRVWVYEDAKGYKGGATYELFKLKKKLIEARFNVTIREV